MKVKFLGLVMALVLCLSSTNLVYADTESDDAVEDTVYEELAIESEDDSDSDYDDSGDASISSVNVSLKNKTIAVGSSYSKSFKMGVFLGTAHNTFDIKVNNPSGKYRIIIKGDNGYSRATGTFTSHVTYTVSNAVKGVKYTVYIVNMDTEDITADITIYSYYGDEN